MHRSLPYLISVFAIPALYFSIDTLVEDTTPPRHVYLLDGKIYTHTTKESLDAHIAALWTTYCERHTLLNNTRPKSSTGYKTGILPPDMLKDTLDGIENSLLSNTDGVPEGMPNAKHKPFREAYARCTRAKLLQDGLDFMQDIASANPSYLNTDPSGYYDDRNGGVLCIVSNKGKYDVYVGAGRGPYCNSDRTNFTGELKNEIIKGEPIPNEPERKPELLVNKGMAYLTGAGDRLDATYVRIGMLTKAGKDMVPVATLGSQVTEDAGSERYLEFIKDGVNFFRPKPIEYPDIAKEAMILVGYKPEDEIE